MSRGKKGAKIRVITTTKERMGIESETGRRED